MSGRPATTRKTSVTITATTISLRTIAHTFLLSDLAQDFFYRADRVREGGPHRLRKPHSRAHIGRLAGHKEAATGTTAHGGEHSEEVIG